MTQTDSGMKEPDPDSGMMMNPDGNTNPGDGHLAANPPDKITECKRTIAPAQSGLCDVTAGTSGKLLRGTILLEHEVLHTGEVLVDDQGRITCAACDCSSSPGYSQATIIACEKGVISPGLINPHDHITYANNAPAQHGMERYDQRHDWRLGKRGHTKISVKSGAPANVVLFAELRFMMGGATGAVSSGGKKGLIRNFDQDDPALYSGAPVQAADFDTFPLDDTSGPQPEMGCSYGSQMRLATAISGDEGYLPHIAEGVDKAANNELVCTSMGKNDLIQRQTAIIHAIATTPEQAALMRDRQTMVVWSPRSNIDLYGNTASVTMLDAEGVPIALGTDWVPSGSMNLNRELRCASDLNDKYYGKHFSDGDLFRMVTIHAAYAAGAQRVLGSIAPGKIADISIYDGSTNKDHRAVIDSGVEDVALVMRGGAPLYGDQALMDALGQQACESLGDVCGKQKRACVLQDTGVPLATIRSAGEAIYPLFFCKDKVPTNEPSCVPYRSTYASGITMTDKDGDGIADDKDNCPSTFNAIRPMDMGMKQADTDGDGIGDACDACPRDATNKCTKPNTDDIDNDGVIDALDVCPEKADPSQADADGDGVGDACDVCPVKNPGAVPCPATIVQVRDPNAQAHLPDKAIVSLPAAYVIAPGSDFYVQDSTSPFSGLQVRAGTSFQAIRGNKVAIEGVMLTIYGMTSIVASKITVADSGTTIPLAPVVVSAMDVKTGEAKASSYQSMLVELDNVTITNDIPDGSGKYWEFIVNGGVRIDDFLFLRYGLPSNSAYPGPGFTNNTVFQKIVGVMGYSFDNAKVWPRDNSDIVR